jgi:FMN phosphatase YigB (HAD superfamily)
MHAGPKRILLDFGFVFTQAQDPSVFDALLEELGLERGPFMAAWARYRLELDRGSLTPAAYWKTVLASCGVEGAEGFVDARLAELIETDLAAWMLPRKDVHALLQGFLDSGIDLAILSNMPPGIGARFEAAWPWIQRIPHRLFSGDIGLEKPNPAFYFHFLERSGWEAASTLFVDDLKVNIEAAAALGFAVHHFIEEADAMRAMSEWVAA